MKSFVKDGFCLRLSTKDDKDKYIKSLMNCSTEVAYFTGGKSSYTVDEVDKYFTNCLSDDERYDFLLFDGDKIIGEAVLNELDEEVKSAHYRVCIFFSEYFNKGLGSFMTDSMLDIAFRELLLQRVGLEVFSYNTRAVKVYEKSGFVIEGRLRNAILNKDEYADIICMSILKDEYEKQITIDECSKEH